MMGKNHDKLFYRPRMEAVLKSLFNGCKSILIAHFIIKKCSCNASYHSGVTIEGVGYRKFL